MSLLLHPRQALGDYHKLVTGASQARTFPVETGKRDCANNLLKSARPRHLVIKKKKKKITESMCSRDSNFKISNDNLIIS